MFTITISLYQKSIPLVFVYVSKLKYIISKVKLSIVLIIIQIIQIKYAEFCWFIYWENSSHLIFK